MSANQSRPCLSYFDDLDDICFEFERREDGEVERESFSSEGSGSALGAALAGGCALFFGASLVVGAFTIREWLFGLVS